MKRYNALHRLVKLLYQLQNQYPVDNPFRSQLHKLHHAKYESLLHLLTCQITLLNRHERLKENGSYRSEQADLVAALSFMKSEINGQTLINPYMTVVVDRLSKRFGKRMFQAKDVSQLLRCSKSSANRMLQKLRACKLVKRIGGNQHHGFYYELVRKRKE